MKRFLETIMAIGLVVLLVSTGFAGELFRAIPYGPGGPGGPVRHVTGSFVRDTSTDVLLAPWGDILELGQSCVINSANVPISGDIVGENPILSDVFCMSESTGRDEAVGWINGTLDGKPIYMLGRMTIDINLSNGNLTGYWVFQEGVGTHYGVFSLVGQVDFSSGYAVSTGTYTGWVRKNKTPHLSKSGR